MLALAVLLIVVGALLSALVVVRSGHKLGYVVLTHDLQPGEQVESADLGITWLAVGAGSTAAGVPRDKRDVVVGEYATARLYAGTIITGRMFTRQQPIPPESAIVGVVLSATQMPAGGIHAGDVVAVVEATASAAGTVGPGTASTLVSAVRVTEATGNSDGAHVSLLVPAAMVETFTAAAVNKSIVLVKLPPTVRPVVGIGSADSTGSIDGSDSP